MISEQLRKIILAELHLHAYPLDDSTVAETVPGWDSLSHARLIMAVEDAFKVRFKTAEVLRLRNLGDLQALIDRHLQPGSRSAQGDSFNQRRG